MCEWEQFYPICLGVRLGSIVHFGVLRSTLEVSPLASRSILEMLGQSKKMKMTIRSPSVGFAEPAERAGAWPSMTCLVVDDAIGIEKESR